MSVRVAGVGCLFKIEQFFKSPEATLCGLDRLKAVLYEPNEGQIAHRVRFTCQTPLSGSACWALRA
jgi:hypothetical protein